MGSVIVPDFVAGILSTIIVELGVIIVVCAYLVAKYKNTKK